MKGLFVVSLDFELMWGLKDCATVEGYGSTNVSQVPLVIERLLELFKRYNIHSTFSTVGLLMLKNASEAVEKFPSVLPSYKDQNLSPYSINYINGIKKEYEPLFFAPCLIEKLKVASNIEIGSHTFGHFYCNAEGQTVEQFSADIERAVEVASEKEIKLQSIVFPRNNVRKEYLEICHKYGICVYRGNAKKFFTHTQNKIHSILQRVCRLIDAYINIGGRTSFGYREIKSEDGMVNVPASRMLRPYSSRLAFAEKLRLRRIKREISLAAQRGEVYHLWWHPHNFGLNIDENFKFLENILKHFEKCREEYGMISCTMIEASEIIKINKF